jgi:SDR family mycofactocin-dependent oxidoreductase
MGMLDGKVALITGGARGQGRAHAVTSAREGADVVVIDLVDQIGSVPYALSTQADLDETVRQVEALGRRVLGFAADVRSQDDLDAVVSQAIAEFGQIDILIANAGIWTRGSFWELTEDTWKDMIDINLTGVWHSAKAVAPHMIERGTGSIVITSSTNGLEAAPDYAHYVSAKHAVIGLMKSIALELAQFGIRCNAVAPGAIMTPMINHQLTWDSMIGGPGGTEDNLIDGVRPFHALKGAGPLDPQVVADAALYLNSELASAVTGVTIPVDAGHLILPGFNHSPQL